MAPVSHYQIGDLRVELGRARVTRGTTELTVPGLTFDLLVVLARHAPNIASTEMLLQEVWPQVVVSPENLSQRVKLLRETLGDDPQSPKYVASVRGRGYRLLPPVQVYRDGVVEGAVVQKRQAEWRPRAWLTIVALALVAGAIWATRYRDSARPLAALPGVALPRAIAVLPFRDLGGGSQQDVLALGVPEAVLHRLAGQNSFPVIARTSSFAVEKQATDAREIGRRLNARYLVEGSVQRDRERLRVTAQLIDAQSGDHVWSIQFDKSPRDIFQLQDDIASEVAQALKISLDAGGASGLPRLANGNFDAYLEYLQGRRLLSTWRSADMETAARHAERAIAIEPEFAAAHVLLASARLSAAEFNPGDNREQVFRDALPGVRRLLDRAIELDARSADAYSVRGYLNAFSDPVAAEADYRRSLTLNPNESRAYEGLAALLFGNLERRDEIEELIDRARVLDPLEPRLDVLKATYLQYQKDDFANSEKLLITALNKDPLYQPALQRLAQLYWTHGRLSDGIRISEQVVAADPEALQAQQILQYLYFAVGDMAAANSVSQGFGQQSAVLATPLLLFRQQWRDAGDEAYRAAQAQTIPEVGEAIYITAIRRHARATGNFARAIRLLAARSHTTWDPSDAPVVDDPSGIYCNVVGLGDMLIATGEADRGRRLLEAALAKMDRDVKLGVAEVWTLQMRPVALALLGRNAEALDALERALALHVVAHHPQLLLTIEPALQGLHSEPRFTRLVAAVNVKISAEMAKVAALRASKMIPERNK